MRVGVAWRGLARRPCQAHRLAENLEMAGTWNGSKKNLRHTGARWGFGRQSTVPKRLKSPTVHAIPGRRPLRRSALHCTQNLIGLQTPSVSRTRPAQSRPLHDEPAPACCHRNNLWVTRVKGHSQSRRPGSPVLPHSGGTSTMPHPTAHSTSLFLTPVIITLWY